MKKLFWYIWSFFLLLIIGHYVYALNNSNSIEIVNTEHKFYLCVLGLSAISLTNLKYGKALIYFILFFMAHCLAALPEMQTIMILGDCNEGRCQAAEEMGLVKIHDNKIEYIDDKIEYKTK